MPTKLAGKGSMVYPFDQSLQIKGHVMAQSLKLLLAVLLSFIFLGSAIAPVGSAAPINSEKSTTVLTDPEAEGALRIKSFPAFEVACHEIVTSSTLASKEVKSMEMLPEFRHCRNALGGNEEEKFVSWLIVPCELVLSTETTEHENTAGKSEVDAPVSIECENGTMQLLFSGCTIKIPEQKGLHGVTYDNEGQGTERDIKLRWTVDKMKYTVSGTKCSKYGLPSEGSGSDMTFTGTSTLKGFEDLEAQGPFTGQRAFKTGKQVGVWSGSSEAPEHEFQYPFEGVFAFQNGPSVLGAKSGSFEVECTKEGTVIAEGSALRPESFAANFLYEECEESSLGSTKVETNGCRYILFATITEEHLNTSGGSVKDAPAAIECTAGQGIKILIPGCTITIPSQGTLSGVTYDDQGEGPTKDIEVTLRLDDVQYNTPGGFFCSFFELPGKEGLDGFITESLTLAGAILE